MLPKFDRSKIAYWGIRMRFFVGLFFALCLPAQAAVVDNGVFNTDTVSGLDWLDLTETTNMTMLQAEAAYSGSGWRMATESEVRYLFDQLFEGFYDNFSYGGSYGGSATDGNLGPAYAGHVEDVRNFHSLFGSVLRNGVANYNTMWGHFLDDGTCLGDPCVRSLGARINEDAILSSGLPYSLIHGPDFYAYESQEYKNAYYNQSSSSSWGTYLVRSSLVPIPAAVWLFGSALAGLGWMRRRQAA